MATAVSDPPTDARPRKHRWRGWWLRQLHTWHWVSAAASLAGMLLFALTGLTLNHAARIGATPVVTPGKAQLPPPLVRLLAGARPKDSPLPAAVAHYGADRLALDPAGRAVDWSDDEAYVALPGPGRDAWISIDRASGAVTSEVTERGWVSYLNDLHKGRNTGPVWFWFIDAFAGACVLFTLTGLLLLQLHARRRPSTWPLVGLSLALPVILAHFI